MHAGRTAGAPVRGPLGGGSASLGDWLRSDGLGWGVVGWCVGRWVRMRGCMGFRGLRLWGVE